MTAVLDPPVDLLEDHLVERLPGRTQVPKVSKIDDEPVRTAPTRRVPPAGITEDQVAKAMRKLHQTNPATQQRVHTLRLVMAGLEGITFEEAASVLGARPDRLARWLHETDSIPRSRDSHLADLHEMLRLLHQLVPRSNTGRWLRLHVPALDGTPLEALIAGRVGDVLRVTQRYTESSFA